MLVFQIYKGLSHAVATMLRTEGILSFYKGLVPSLLQIMPQTGVQFASFRLFSQSYWALSGKGKQKKIKVWTGDYQILKLESLWGVSAQLERCKKIEWVKLFIAEKEDKLPFTGNLICGGLAGIAAKVAVYPLDLSKKRLQVQGFEEARLHFGKVRHSYTWQAPANRKYKIVKR